MKLSDNFTLQEFTTSETAMRNNIAEQYQPSLEIVNNLKNLALHIAEPIRSKFGSFSPTCAYRCKRLNDKVKGAKTSLHLKGCAFDETFIKNGLNISGEVFFWILKGGIFKFTELIWELGDENNPSWLHIGYDEKNLSKEILVAKKNVFGKIGYINYLGSELNQKHKAHGKV
jgi:hypothetical protein